MKIYNVQINQNKQNIKKNNNFQFCDYKYNYSFKAIVTKSEVSRLEKFAQNYILNLGGKVSNIINEELNGSELTKPEKLGGSQVHNTIDDGLNEAVTYIIERFFKTGTSRLENYIGGESFKPYITDVYGLINGKEELLFQIRNGKIEVINLLQTKHGLLKPKEINMLEFFAKPTKENWSKLKTGQKINLGIHGILYES